MKIYALEPGALRQLLADRRELFAAARAYGTAAEMRAARDDLMASAQVYRTPTAEKPLVLDVRGGVAHIPVVGELTPSADPCGAFSMQGETEYGFIHAALREADARDDVASIQLDVDSHGGYMAGLDEVAQAIASVSKPVTSVVGSMAASAAYYLASQADHIVALSPASRVGSIGVAMEEYDDDEAMARDGVAHRVYTSTDAPDKRPDTKTPEGRAKLVAQLDALHEVFVRRVAEGRHVEPAKVSKDFGRGGVLTAERAMAVGMIDEVIGSHLSRPVFDAGVAGSAASATAAVSHIEEVHMDLSQLKAEHPDLVAQISAEAEDAGIKKERTRREALLAFKGKSDAVDIAVEAAIASGETYEQAMPKITAAAVFSLPGENPPAVGTKAPDTASGAGDLTAEDIAAANIVGMSLDEYRKYAEKE